MPAPTPPKSVKGSCSVINGDTLYVFSPDAFQSIQLQDNSTWQELDSGVSVTGGACVTATIDNSDNQALYVIGGTTNSSTSGYSGLQRFSFDDNSWETVQLPSDVMRNRLRHGANFIPRDKKLVVYGGSAIQGYTGASSETFTIDLQPPYPVAGYSSNSAPPASRPFIMPWGDDSVVYTGGSSTNRKIYTFTAGGGWVEFKLDLPQPLPDPSVAQVSMFNLAADAFEDMQVIQMGQEPIGVTSYVILGPGAQPPATVETIGAATPPSVLAARQESLSNYPAYNGSSVPSTTRTDFSSAQGNNGILALVGGDDDGSVTFFSQADNTWVAAEQVLGDAPQQVIQPSTTAPSSSSTTPTATRTSSPSATSAAANKNDGNGSRTWTILGGVLGGLCGLVAILIIILLCIRNKRREKKRAESKHKSYPAGKKGSSDFDFEDGMHPLRENGQPMADPLMPHK
ncbi:uncharacterized protein AB675_5325 [Cyphellophora attinorum]|uniref:Kelch repeat-containing protein n=1 Tax=Cyphellophora attinorum TaxID=1664694 RepID=A0A0N1P1B2_9EURO|nr:uncharacterized protein AB675_5325 [Phialophora attinorum]KPI41812.1 hypothetical protein AB675_5325 [Phialophora attinorum]